MRYNRNMKKMFIFSAIHGNLEALQRIVSHIGKKTFNETEKLFLGDYVDFGPWPEKTISFLRTIPNARFILGNHDLYLLDETDNLAKTYFKNDELVEHIDWTRAQLSKESKEWLNSLHSELNLSIGKKSVLVFHGDYQNPERGLMLENIKKIKEDCIFCGHIHAPYIHNEFGKIILNPGSVGESLDGDNRASFAVIEADDDNAELNCRIERIPYNLQKVKREMMRRNMPLWEELYNTMSTGKFEVTNSINK